MLRRIHQQVIWAWSYLCVYKVAFFKHFIHFIKIFQIYWLGVIPKNHLLFLKTIEPIVGLPFCP